MKLFTLLLSLLLFYGPARAQLSNIINNTSVGVAPLGVFTKLRGKIEYIPPESKVTFGTYGSLHHPLFVNGVNTIEYLGVTAEPFIRWYAAPDADKFYFQLKPFFGVMHYEYTVGSWLLYDFSEGTFFSLGLGAGVGYQHWFGKNKTWYLDTNFGLRLTSASDDGLEWLQWYWSGPGSIINSTLCIGFKI